MAVFHDDSSRLDQHTATADWATSMPLARRASSEGGSNYAHGATVNEYTAASAAALSRAVGQFRVENRQVGTIGDQHAASALRRILRCARAQC